MKIAVVGCGLGYSLSCVLAVHGHDVLGIDIDTKAFSKPRLDDFMLSYTRRFKPMLNQNVKFSTEYSLLADRELIFIFVATPLLKGRLSSHQVISALTSCLEHSEKSHYALLSTMGIGALDGLFNRFPVLRNNLNYVPPQIRAGNFYETFVNPPTAFQMISNNADWHKILGIYKPIMAKETKFIVMDYRIIEMAKLLINAFLANKIVFANAVDDWCRQEGLDAAEVMKIVGQDPRVSSRYTKPNGAVGGSCLPRDVIELISASSGSPFRDLLEVLQSLNDERAKRYPSPIPVRY